MLDVRINTIIYQSQVYYSTLVNRLVANKKLGKALDCEWTKADLILAYLEALGYVDRVTNEDDRTEINYILNCLIKLCELNTYPVNNPLVVGSVPTASIGIRGAPGEAGEQGQRGEAGLATDFQVSLVTSPTVVDSFDIDDAKGARWDYVVIKSTGEQRSGSIIGTWTPTGSSVEYNDSSTADLVGSTEALEFVVQYSAGDIQLVVVPASGQWTVIGTRYFIPNNGTGTGPISGSLANGKIYIGNASNLATAQTVSGVLAITNIGVTSFNAGVIINADINASAAIAVSKLATLTANQIVITTAGGVLSTTASPTLTELGYVAGASSSLQTQITNKLTDPLTTIGDIIIRNGSNVTTRLGSGSSGQVLTISGSIPSWQTPVAGFADPLTTVGDLMYRNSGNVTTRLPIGSPSQVLTMSGGVPIWATPSAGFADPMTTIGDVMVRNASNVTARVGIGSSGQVLTVTGGVPVWANIPAPTNGITGTLVSGRVTLSSGTNTITDDADLTFSTSGNLLTLTSGEFTGGVTELLLTTQSGNQAITLRPHGTGRVQLQSANINIGSDTISGNRIIEAKSLSSSADISLAPKQPGSATGLAGSGTVLLPSVGIGVGQPFRVGGGGYVDSPGYYALYDQNTGPDISVYTAEKIIEIGPLAMNSGSASGKSHGLTDSKILSVTAVVWDDSIAGFYECSTSANNLGSAEKMSVTWSSGIIFLEYLSSAFSSGFSSVAINRGRFYIKYIAAGI